MTAKNALDVSKTHSLNNNRDSVKYQSAEHTFCGMNYTGIKTSNNDHCYVIVKSSKYEQKSKHVVNAFDALSAYQKARPNR